MSSTLEFYEPLPIYNSTIDANVIYCSADGEEVEEFVVKNSALEGSEYIHCILSNFIGNWSAIKQLLKTFDAAKAQTCIQQLYNGCVMLNPALDDSLWESLSANSLGENTNKDVETQEIISLEKFNTLKPQLQSQIIGQDHVIDSLCDSLKRAVSGLNDELRPLGVFLFAGSTGSGKTQTAKTLHNHLFEDYGHMIRIDCGEYQHKHENQKLIGCFAPDTPITLDNEDIIPIEKITIGDKVLTHKGRSRIVQDTYTYDYDGYMVHLYTTNSAPPLVATPQHEIFAIRDPETSTSPTWVSIEQLDERSIVVFPNENHYVFFKVTHKENKYYSGPVYDLSVEDDVSYIANGIAVHNSPPGYVASDEGGHLTNQLKANNKAVLLFDEVEKAHPDLWHTLLRSFDEGIITDAKGKQHSLKNTIVVMTTNLGMQKTMNSVSNARVGFNAKDGNIEDGVQPSFENLQRNALDAIRDFFPSEFLNRIDKTIVFNVLTESDIKEIAKLELGEVNKKLEKRGASLAYNEKVVEALAKSGVHVAEGARRITRQRREKVENAISDAILGSDGFTSGSVVDLSYDEGYEATVRESDA